MLPNINRNGSSFRGAGAYHLHDKGEEGQARPVTSERVAWTSTRNLVNEEPAQAIDEMWHTAEAAAQLKRMSGQDRRGRKCEDPVKTISLSWAPQQTPSRDEMEVAADSFLEAMGWQEHQALLVAHTDTAHPHLHIILNRVHPDTGRVLNDWREQQRAQRWAHAYESEQGLILCHARAEKHDKGRFDLRPDGMPYPYAKLAQQQERAFDNPLAEAAVQDRAEKDLLAERHQREREEFLASGRAQFRRVRQAAYREARDEFKPLWRAHFEHASDVRDQLEDAARFAHGQAVRLARAGEPAAAMQVLAALDEQRDAAEASLSLDRQALRQNQLDSTRERQDQACRSLIGLRGIAFQDIKDRQKDERAELKELQAAREAGQAYDIDRLQQLTGEADAAAAPANDNELPADVARSPAEQERALTAEAPAFNPFSQQAYELFGRAGFTERDAKTPSRDLTDIGSAAIGAMIEVGVRLMDGFIAPPSPKERAIAKAWAAREAVEAPKRAEARREEKMRDDFMRHALAAVREAQAEQDHKRERDWEERGRSRERER